MRLSYLLSLGVLMALATTDLSAQQWTQCNNRQGYAGIFYTHWSDVSGSGGCMRMRGRAGFSYNYGATGNTVGGKGWEYGSTKRKIGYNVARFNKRGSGGKLWVCAYGWMERQDLGWNDRNRRVEYYVIDNWKGEWPLRGNGATAMGPRYTIPGEGTYQAYRAYRYNAPNYYGANRDFVQYFSIRTSKRALRNSNGSLKNLQINMRRHFKEWNERCMPVGNPNGYQVIAIEAFGCGADTWVGVWNNGNDGNWLGNACTKSANGDKETEEVAIDFTPTEMDLDFAPIASPNPTRDFTTIAGLTNEEATIQVMTMAGQQVANLKVQPGAGMTSIDLSTYQPGIYLVSVTQGTQHKLLRVSRQ